MKKYGIFLMMSFLVSITITGFSFTAIAGEDPKIIYSQTDGAIDTATDTGSDGYMRTGTKLLVNCETNGGDCPTTPNPPSVKEGPVARNDAYYWNTTGGCEGTGSSCSHETYSNVPKCNVYTGRKWIDNCEGGIPLPVLSNDDAGLYGPVTITLGPTYVLQYKKKTWTTIPGESVGFTIKLSSSGKGIVASSIYNGASFKYTITDTLGQSSEATVTISESRDDSPLVLDLDVDGVEMLPLSQGVPFDINMDGVLDKISWIKSDDGFLALDRDKDGMITHRRELFGNMQDENLPDGFANLLRYDDNKDYIMDARDKIFGSLLIWRDLNKDGIGTPNELKSVTSYGITSINLNAVKVGLIYGASDTTITHQSTYTLKDGTKHQIADVWFAQTLGEKPVEKP